MLCGVFLRCVGEAAVGFLSSLGGGVTEGGVGVEVGEWVAGLVVVGCGGVVVVVLVRYVPCEGDVPLACELRVGEGPASIVLDGPCIGALFVARDRVYFYARAVRRERGRVLAHGSDLVAAALLFRGRCVYVLLFAGADVGRTICH